MNSAPQKLVIPNKLLTSDAFLGSGNPRIAFILRSLGLMPSLPMVCPRNSSDLLLYFFAKSSEYRMEVLVMVLLV